MRRRLGVGLRLGGGFAAGVKARAEVETEVEGQEGYLLSVELDELAACVPEAISVESLPTGASARAGRATLAIEVVHLILWLLFGRARHAL